MSEKIAVIAIGGNSLVKDKAHQSIADQYQAVNETCKQIADMTEKGWTVAIGHGNGPQVGFVLRRSEIAHQVEGIHEVPLNSVAPPQGYVVATLHHARASTLAHEPLDRDRYL